MKIISVLLVENCFLQSSAPSLELEFSCSQSSQFGPMLLGLAYLTKIFFLGLISYSKPKRFKSFLLVSDSSPCSNHTPVSYTHLDVYKRQVIDTTNFMEQGRHAFEMIMQVRSLHRATSHLEIFFTSSCLLYTSRCV